MCFVFIRLEFGGTVSGVTKGGARGDICPRAHHFGGAKLRSECYVLITKCEMSADANN